MPTLIRCPGCNQLRSPAALPCPTCPTCAAHSAHRQRRARTGLAIACAILGLCLLLLLLTSCTGDPTTASDTAAPPRRSIADIRASLIAAPASAELPAGATPWPAIDPAAIDPVYCHNGNFEGKPYYWCGANVTPAP